MPPPKLSLTREELAELPLGFYEGPIELIQSDEGLDRALESLRSERIIGLDTETPPTFKVGQVNLPTLVQIAASDAVYLFQLAQRGASGIENTLARILEDGNVTKVGIGLHDDFKKLRLRFDFTETNVLDLGSVVREQGLKQTGVRNLAGLFLGVRISKGQKTSNWGRRVLSRSQIRYAATDAWICRELYLHFQSKGFIR